MTTHVHRKHQYGPRLAKWITENLPSGRTWNAVATANGIEPTRLIAWRNGSTPGLDQLTLVGVAFNQSLAEMLVHIGALAPDKVQRVEVPVYDVASAVEHDPSLDGEARTFLRQCLKQVRRPLATR